MSSSISMTSTESSYKPLSLTMKDIRRGMKEYFIRDGINYASIYGKEKMLVVYEEFLINQTNFKFSQEDLKFIFTNLSQI